MSDLSSEQHFDVGEIAILAYSRFGRASGVECVVVSPLGVRLNLSNGQYENGYVIEVDGNEYIALPDQLRKKRPPRENLQLVRWDQCPWQPAQVRA